MIEVNEVGIKFKMTKRRRSKASDILLEMTKNRHRVKNEFWALHDISFSVERGETLGIIGGNGSGKSTLLRVIAGVYPPDEGKISIRGEVSTLFSLGAGFQVELSGRDNIYLNGIMIGLTKKYIDNEVERIIDFAELGDFIDMPVRIYSSGMRARLGFAIAIHSGKDIMLIDEIMGAGDIKFRQKANAEMSRLIGEKTVVMVSHNMGTIEKFADKAIWLKNGTIAAIGEARQVTNQYLESCHVIEPSPCDD
jgi:ABC-type polysaccharide/polyol phosphate transport system ATPase subunit